MVLDFFMPFFVYTHSIVYIRQAAGMTMTLLRVNNTFSLKGRVKIPGSKSQSIRALIISLLSNGKSTLTNVAEAEDIKDGLSVCKTLGAIITPLEKKLQIMGTGIPLHPGFLEINTGNSGITTRFILPLLGFRQNNDRPFIVDCAEQMRARPIKSLIDALRNLGLTIQYVQTENKLPVAVSGELTGGKTSVEGLTSQFLSALLISLPCAKTDSEITVENLHERPYVDMTLSWLKQQQIEFRHERSRLIDKFYISGKQQYRPVHHTISGDFSSASCLIGAAVLTQSEVMLEGLCIDDAQGDKRLISILQAMGADIHIEATCLLIRGGNPLKGIKIDANDIPDLLPILAVIGTQAAGKTEIMNVKQARLKETDRIHSMTEGLSLLGAFVEEHPDGLTIYQSALKGARVRGCKDHRTVMALSVAGMTAAGNTFIEDADSIHKTYPHFVEDMRHLGAKMEVIHENAF
jgi:3-phosphoshikimate 1-carboxyvinyltransferase